MCNIFTKKARCLLTRILLEFFLEFLIFFALFSFGREALEFFGNGMKMGLVDLVVSVVFRDDALLIDLNYHYRHVPDDCTEDRHQVFLSPFSGEEEF